MNAYFARVVHGYDFKQMDIEVFIKRGIRSEKN